MPLKEAGRCQGSSPDLITLNDVQRKTCFASLSLGKAMLGDMHKHLGKNGVPPKISLRRGYTQYCLISNTQTPRSVRGSSRSECDLMVAAHGRCLPPSFVDHYCGKTNVERQCDYSLGSRSSAVRDSSRSAGVWSSDFNSNSARTTNGLKSVESIIDSPRVFIARRTLPG